VRECPTCRLRLLVTERQACPGCGAVVGAGFHSFNKSHLDLCVNGSLTAPALNWLGGAVLGVSLLLGGPAAAARGPGSPLHADAEPLIVSRRQRTGEAPLVLQLAAAYDLLIAGHKSHSSHYSVRDPEGEAVRPTLHPL
jgi:hypothetical protein